MASDEMKFKENAGVDPVTLSQGYTKLDGDPPNSGENILRPEHVVDEKRRRKMYADMGVDMDEQDDGPTGFVERDKPSAFERPMRTDDEDAG